MQIELTKGEQVLIRKALFMRIDELRREMKYQRGGYTNENKDEHRALEELISKWDREISDEPVST